MLIIRHASADAACVWDPAGRAHHSPTPSSKRPSCWTTCVSAAPVAWCSQPVAHSLSHERSQMQPTFDVCVPVHLEMIAGSCMANNTWCSCKTFVIIISQPVWFGLLTNARPATRKQRQDEEGLRDNLRNYPHHRKHTQYCYAAVLNAFGNLRKSPHPCQATCAPT